MSEQLSLFDPGPPPTPPPPRRRVPMPRGKPRWSPLAGSLRGLVCDDCAQLHTERPVAPLARRAQWRRVQGGADRYLCGPHAQIWRERDRSRVTSPDAVS